MGNEQWATNNEKQTMGDPPTAWDIVSVPPAAGGEGKLAAAGEEEAQRTK